MDEEKEGKEVRMRRRMGERRRGEDPRKRDGRRGEEIQAGMRRAGEPCG